MLNQIEVRFSNFVSQFALPASNASLDSRLQLLERQGRNAAEEAGARNVETQLFTDPALLNRAKERLESKPTRLARHICASLLGLAMFSGLGLPAHASDGSNLGYTPTEQPGTDSTSVLDVIEELIEDVVELLNSDEEPDPSEGTK